MSAVCEHTELRRGIGAAAVTSYNCNWKMRNRQVRVRRTLGARPRWPPPWSGHSIPTSGLPRDAALLQRRIKHQCLRPTCCLPCQTQPANLLPVPAQLAVLSRIKQCTLDVRSYRLSSAVHHHPHVIEKHPGLAAPALGQSRVTTVYTDGSEKKKTGPLKPALAPRLPAC